MKSDSQLKARDEETLTYIMDQFDQYLLRTAYLLAKDIHLAEECVQDTFILAYEKMDQLKDQGRLKGWLTVILLNQCKKRMRKWSFKHILLRDKEQEEVELEAIDHNPEELALLEEQKVFLTAAIHALDYKYREAVTLYYYNEWSVQEIAGYLNTNVNTIKTRLARARKLLKEMIDKGAAQYE